MFYCRALSIIKFYYTKCLILANLCVKTCIKDYSRIGALVDANEFIRGQNSIKRFMSFGVGENGLLVDVRSLVYRFYEYRLIVTISSIVKFQMWLVSLKVVFLGRNSSKFFHQNPRVLLISFYIFGLWQSLLWLLYMLNC